MAEAANLGINEITRHEAYGMWEAIARTGVPGAQASYDRLKVRFAALGRPAGTGETEI